MLALSEALYTAAQIREIDRLAITEYAIPGETLMARAGAAAWRELRQRWPAARHVAVLCGSGNNGGDGYVLARLAREAGLQVTVWKAAEPHPHSGAACAAYEALRATGIIPHSWSENASLDAAEVIVDGLLGTGLDREVTGVYRTMIIAVNAARRPVLALDIPSGLHADTGQPLGVAVRAAATVSFIGLKQGLYTGQARDYVGAISYSTLDVPEAVYARLTPRSRRLDAAAMTAFLPPRPRSAHKGAHGHVLVIGGDYGMMGAARLAAEAALRVGSGLVSAATRPEHATAISGALPEIMSYGVIEARALTPWWRRATHLAIGPGLGQSVWSRALWDVFLEAKKPAVVDADALNLLAQEPQQREDWVLTPHPGEAARLLDTTVADIEQDRFAAVRALQQRYGGVCVLKGAGSLIGDATGVVAVCDAGNPGLGSGGMGDVLSGVIAGLMAQGLTAADAARVGVWAHATAGDHAARDGERGLLAREVIAALRGVVNPRCAS